MFTQTEIDWSQSVHTRENNPESQAHLNANRKRWSAQNELIFKAMERGERPNNYDSKVYNPETGQYQRIGHLPKRIEEIRRHIEEEKLEYVVKDKWMDNVRFKEYFL